MSLLSLASRQAGAGFEGALTERIERTTPPPSWPMRNRRQMMGAAPPRNIAWTLLAPVCPAANPGASAWSKASVLGLHDQPPSKRLDGARCRVRV